MGDFEDSIREDIARDGVSIIYVGDASPPFAYTIGLWQEHKHPELILLGLPGQVMWGILNSLSQSVKDGQSFLKCSFVENIGGKFGVQILPVSESNLENYFGFGINFYGERFPASQVVWPDNHGNFPNNPSYLENYAELQPLLGKYA